MSRTKSLRRNAAYDEPMLIQPGKSFFETCKGNWRSEYFKNDHPIVLELACGRGEYTVGLSQIYPEKNFIGVDIKGERMMMGIRKWKEETNQTSPQPLCLSQDSSLAGEGLLSHEKNIGTIGKGGYLHTLAKKNRKEMTTSEEYLWHIVRDRQVGGLKFRRQHPIKGYIADFYCAEYKLIIEVDGGYHMTLSQQEYDTIRDELLTKHGYTILRFTNEEINNNIDELLQKIVYTINKFALATVIPLGQERERGGGLYEGMGARYANQNIGFLRTIIHHLDRFFAPEEIDEIWIVHPDPRSKGFDERRRLTSPRFLHMYYDILKSGGLLRLKTDDEGLFDYSLTSLGQRSSNNTTARVVKELVPDSISGRFVLVDQTRDLYQSSLLGDHHSIRTYYEQMFVQQGRNIHYGIRKKR